MAMNGYVNKIIKGDALETLRLFPSNSIDAIITDPPYQLSSTTRSRSDQSINGSYGKEVPFSRQQSRIRGFMQKEWDVLPKTEVWKECLRVLKSGAFAFVMCTPRQDSLLEMLLRIREAGFVMSFSSLIWTYASGFPKASNISKMVDKKLGVESEIIGMRPSPSRKNAKKVSEWGYGSNDIPIEKPMTPQAKALDGSYGGFQPKPAVEIIIVAMKPLSEKTFVDQALKNRHGITWLDDCKIPYASEKEKQDAINMQSRPSIDIRSGSFVVDNGKVRGNLENIRGDYSDGRFPANLLCSDDVLNDGKITKSTGGLTKNEPESASVYGKYNQIETIKPFDSGSFSRYFSLDAWWEKKITELPESVQKTFPFLIVPKASKSERDKGLEMFPISNESRKKAALTDAEHGVPHQRNIHPTCKPIKLMSYLITLGSREGDIVLDPFCGSGTTCISAKILRRNYVGIEMMEEYVKIAEARVKACGN